MNRRDKLKLIKSILNGSVNSIELKKDVEVWIQEPGKDLFTDVKSGKILTRQDLDRHILKFTSQKFVKMEFVSSRTIL